MNDYIGLKTSHIFKGETVQSRIYYQGDLNFFKTYSDRVYHNQAIGYDGYTVNSDNKRTLYFGANWSKHDGRDIYDYYRFE